MPYPSVGLTMTKSPLVSAREDHGTLNMHVPTAEEILLLLSIDNARIAEDGGVKVGSVLMGTEEYSVERAVGAIRAPGADYRGRCVAGIPDK